MPPRRTRRLLAAILLPVLLSACGGRDAPAAPVADGTPEARAKPAPASTDVSLPVGQPIQLDGRMPSGEWERAAVRAVGSDGTVLRLMQFRGTLLVGFDAPGSWPEGATLTIHFAPDAGGSAAYSPGAVKLNWEPFEHNRPHLLVSRFAEQSEQGVEGRAVARATLETGRTQLEIALDLRLLGVAQEGDPPLRFALLLARGGGTRTVTWPAGLSVDPVPGRAPEDIANTARWGRLFGWVDPAGPGALPVTDREALLAEDAELYRRGNQAHGAVLLIQEETSLQKVDREMVPELVDNLRWIAEREPLSPYDLLVLARGYRFLNRGVEALAILDALQSHATWRQGERVLYERAVTLEALERYEEAAAAWSAAADVVRGPNAERYRSMVAVNQQRLVGWKAEQAARAEDDARDDLPLVRLRTNRGEVLVRLHRDDVPASVAHFLGLVERREGERGFYDGTAFHRVIGGFMAQGGDPASRDGACEDGGAGDGPETIPIETNARHGFYRGAVGFARGPSHENGCQFFVMVSARPELAEKRFTCFGHVVSGMDVVDRLERCDVLLEARVLEPVGAGEGAPGDR